jgi:hypothetical protein
MFPTGGHRAVFEIPPPSITCGRKKMGNRSVSGGCGQRFNLPPTPWVKARTGGIGPGRSAPQPLALAIGHRTGKASTGHRACKVRRAASIRARARAGTAPGQGQAVTQQGTGEAGRTGGIDPGRVAPSTQPPALALAIGHGTGKAPGLQGQAGRIDPGTGRHRTTSRASGHAAGHRAPGTGHRHQVKGWALHGQAGAGEPGRIDPGGSAPNKGQVIEPKAGEQTGRFCVFCLRYRYFVRGMRGMRGIRINRGLQRTPQLQALRGQRGQNGTYPQCKTSYQLILIKF